MSGLLGYHENKSNVFSLLLQLRVS